MEVRSVTMFINYEHQNHVYNVTIERRDNQFFIVYDNNEYTVNAAEDKPGQLKMKVGDRLIKAIITEGKESKFVFIDGDVFQVRRIELSGQKKSARKKSDLNSPISGTVVDVKVKEGAKVKKGDIIMVIEAMKMEYLIRAPYNGIVKELHFKAKQQIEIGQLTALVEKQGA